MTTNKSYMGIDPGVKNLGLVIIDEYDNVIHKETLNMESMLEDADVSYIIDLAKKYKVVACALERFVAYSGVQSSSQESINRLIGGLEFMLNSVKIKVFTVKAIDWKRDLVKHLYKKVGFENPSDKLDKKFSIAAAAEVTGEQFEVDHEADAACLAYMTRKGCTDPYGESE